MLALGSDAFLPERKKALLLHCLGAEGQRIFYSLDTASVTSSTQDAYQKALGAIEAYFVPRINVVAERYRFRRRRQRSDETVLQFVTALQELVTHCAFGNLKEEMIRDQVVESCYNTRIRERLLLEPDLTLKKVLDCSSCIEDAERESKTIAQGSGVARESVYKLQRQEGKRQGKGQKYNRDSRGKKQSCRNCGSTYHASFDEKCKAKGTKCHSCGKIGHWAKFCRQSREVRAVHAEDELDLPQVLHVYVNTHPAKLIRCEAELAGKAKVQMTVDTGSSVSIIPLSIYKKDFLVEALQPSNVKISDYSRGRIPVVGIFQTRVKVGAKSMNANIFVVRKGSALLGMDIFGGLNLRIEGSTLLVETVTDDSSTSSSTSTDYRDIEQEFPTLFATGLGKARNFKHRVKVKADHAPVQQKLRRLPLSVKEGVARVGKIGEGRRGRADRFK